jgi:hypothetical protein
MPGGAKVGETHLVVEVEEQPAQALRAVDQGQGNHALDAQVLTRCQRGIGVGKALTARQHDILPAPHRVIERKVVVGVDQAPRHRTIPLHAVRGHETELSATRHPESQGRAGHIGLIGQHAERHRDNVIDVIGPSQLTREHPGLFNAGPASCTHGHMMTQGVAPNRRIVAVPGKSCLSNAGRTLGQAG